CLEGFLPPLAEPVAVRFAVGLQDQPGNLQAATADLAEDGPVEIDRGATSGVTRADLERRIASERVTHVRDVTEVQRAQGRWILREGRYDERCVVDPDADDPTRSRVPGVNVRFRDAALRGAVDEVPIRKAHDLG